MIQKINHPSPQFINGTPSSDEPGTLGGSHFEVSELIHFLSCQRVKVSDEKTAQSDLEERMNNAGYTFDREKRLSEKDIPDFLVKFGAINVVIEMKLKAQRKAIYRQLERYASHDCVHAIILFTATAMHLPETINGKPAFVSSIGAGWL